MVNAKTGADEVGARPTGGELTRLSQVSMTRTAAELTDAAGFQRRRVRALQEETKDLHQNSLMSEWRIRTAERAKKSFEQMLEELADMGFSWRDLGRMLRVSVPAIRKWRQGQSPSGESRRRTALLVAACDLVSQHYMVEETASWFEVPLVPEAPVTPIELFANDRIDLVFDFASGQVDPETLLTEFDPEWRPRYSSDFEVFEAEDGQYSLRSKR